jgi:GTP-dependent phosphoenolpyruvate carboxykinase
LELFGPTIHTWWNGQDTKNKDDLIDHMVNLFDNTFNKKVVTKLADNNLKYTRAQYRDKLQIDLKYEHPPMVPEKEWKALIEDEKENLFKKQGQKP